MAAQGQGRDAVVEDAGPAAPTVAALTARFGLQPHPEGGFFCESYRADTAVAGPYGERAASTAIYFLMTPNAVSRLHRIRADECWHFYLGSPLCVVEIHADSGVLTKTVLGPDVLGGQQCQHVVKAGTWFGSYPLEGGSYAYSFVGCTVAPGFTFEDFELASRKEMLAQFPQHAGEIEPLTVGL